MTLVKVPLSPTQPPLRGGARKAEGDFVSSLNRFTIS